MFAVLRECGALARIFPELDRLFGVPQPAKHHPEIDTGVHVMLALDYAAGCGYALAVRFAVLAHDLGKGETPPAELPRHIGHESRSAELAQQVSARLKVPNECRDLAVLCARQHGVVHRALELKPATVLRLLESADALRKPERFEELLQACESDLRGRTGRETEPYPQAQRLRAALRAAAAVDAGAIARQLTEATEIKARVHQARVRAIRELEQGRDQQP
jgi:tRNA nucleotidyltransferase (CCA-adding enzyme)